MGSIPSMTCTCFIFGSLDSRCCPSSTVCAGVAGKRMYEVYDITHLGGRDWERVPSSCEKWAVHMRWMVSYSDVPLQGFDKVLILPEPVCRLLCSCLAYCGSMHVLVTCMLLCRVSILLEASPGCVSVSCVLYWASTCTRATHTHVPHMHMCHTCTRATQYTNTTQYTVEPL